MLRPRRRPRRPGPADPAPGSAAADQAPLPPPPAPLVVDARTRTFWSRAGSPETLVEAAAGPTAAAAGRRWRAPGAAGAEGPEPRGDPAQVERVFVELMRLGRHERAFGLLTDRCREAWGSAERFAAEQAASRGPAVTGLRVCASRRLEAWTDAEGGDVHRRAAELDVEYLVDTSRGPVALRRRVHLVASRGRWRLVCWPPAGAPRAPG